MDENIPPDQTITYVRRIHHSPSMARDKFLSQTQITVGEQATDLFLTHYVPDIGLEIQF